MSKHTPSRDRSHDAPRIEPWLVLASLSLVPLGAAVAVSRAVQVALWTVGGAMLVIALAMCVAGARRHEPASQPASRRSEAA